MLKYSSLQYFFGLIERDLGDSRLFNSISNSDDIGYFKMSLSSELTDTYFLTEKY